MKNNNLKKEISLFMATMLVCGNMIGSGVFMLPATLAEVSGPFATLIAWGITSIGSILIAISFANLGSKYPATGGAYQYTKEAFGEFVGFLSAWLYWNGSWIGNAAIIVALSSYSAAVIPALNKPIISIIYTSSILWIFTIINIVGVKKAGKIQSFATVFKIVFFALFIIVAFLNFDSSNLMPLLPAEKGLNTVPLAAASTLWAFVGLESATVTAGEISNPEKNVKKSTIYGMLIASIIYILISIASMGAMPNDKLAASSAPLTDILTNILGTSIGKPLTIAVIVCILGTYYRMVIIYSESCLCSRGRWSISKILWRITSKVCNTSKSFNNRIYFSKYTFSNELSKKYGISIYIYNNTCNVSIFTNLFTNSSSRNNVNV
ncbi:hypothetical protein JCM1393_23770 [Clostridium carnis]